ncbi:PRC-barrel domain-containing protein [Paralcaligenes ureilyticus]|uniref:Sporulation protein YlmC with PRC-barrel domain n=1 Tax=Paralcaligenes ureilyticus TaxID=627131 RepID=A0A4R3MDK5_9BURK|nr:PRC-barrel domain-containing protein [Paralcaligenes ureilyticus]TCT10157.1 sporulation protein YlmC with PRC-barrel domain [Paralcaligenes ureilyticus]
MKKFLAVALYALPFAMTPTVFAQTAATAPPAANHSPTAPYSANPAAPSTPGAGMAIPANSASTETISGWSVKDKIMSKTVYNEKNEKIGAIEDVVLTPDGKASAFVVGAGGFLGMGEHNVAVPFDKITKTNDHLVLEGYTKDQLKALPEVKVSK